MDPVSPIPAIASLLIAIATAFMLMKRFGEPPAQGRYATIDGLRGYLAFFVFLHHSSVWYFYLRTGQWRPPPSNLYNHLGLSSVLIFFMITGFLFFSKLIDGRSKTIDWGKLFVSRFLRLVPLYLFAMLLLFLVIAFLSDGALNVPISKLLNDGMKWIGFTVLGVPNLNGISNTFTIVAGVTWSLPYEWLFYFSLPLLALTVRVIPPIPYILFGIAGVACLAIFDEQFHNLYRVVIPLTSFLGGISAAFLVRSELLRQIAARKISSIVAVGCIAIAVGDYPSGLDIVPILLMSVAFVLIACGNTLFGILVNPVSRTLGEMSYSIYLLHGITLFITFKLMFGTIEARDMSSIMHWIVVVGITPVLLTLSFFTFRYIESPAMHSTSTFTAWLRSCLKISKKRE